EMRARRTAIEERIAAGEEGRRQRGELLAEARTATERVRARAESLELAERDLRGALGERQLRLDAMDEQPDEAAGAARIAALEAKLAAAAVEGDHEALAGLLETGPGLERALSAVLGERLRASIVGSVDEGRQRLAGAEGAARALLQQGGSGREAEQPPPHV